MNIYIQTYGCQMNDYDTDLIRTILSENNYQFVDNTEDADIILLNTCSVRENAERKVLNHIHILKKDSNAVIGVLGCMAASLQKSLVENPKNKIDFIAGPDSYQKLPVIIDNILTKKGHNYDITPSNSETYANVYPRHQKGINANIAIMRGCNNFCSYCVVPYTRGRERSRSPENIIAEAKNLILSGFKQITLLGQNVNSYSYEHYDFSDLMEMLSDIKELKRIRFTSPHPRDFKLKLLELMSKRDNICNQIHLPIQSGNTRILHKMNRSYTQEHYLALVKNIKSILPDVVLSTDIIIGFPTETEKEFLDTVKVVNEVQFDSAFIFKYSPRPHTYASKKYPDDVTEEEKTKRIVKLNEIQRKISLEKNRACIGKVQEVIIEKTGTKKSKLECQGRNVANKIVIIDSIGNRVGDRAEVKITDATANVLKGSLI